MQRLLVAFIAALLFASPALADSLVHNLSTNTTSPLPSGSCLYVDQGPGTDTKLCSGWAAALGGLVAANNLSDLVSAATARTNLGLGAAAVIGTPVSGANGGTGVANTGDTLTLGGNITLPAAPASTQCLHENSSGVVSATGSDCGSGGSSTGSGVDAGATVQSVTGTTTITSSVVNIASGWTTGTLTLPAISGLGTSPSPRCINDANYLSGSATLTVAANSADSIEGGSTGGNVGPYTSAGAGLCFRVSADISGHHNWNLESGATIPASTAPSNQFANSVGINGLGYAQPAFSNLSGTATSAQLPAATTSAQGAAKLNESPSSIGWVAAVSPNNAVLLSGAAQALTIQSISGNPMSLLGSAGTIDLYDVASGTSTCSSGTKITTSSFNANTSAGTTQSLLSSSYSLAAGHSVCVSVTSGTFSSGSSIATITMYANPT